MITRRDVPGLLTSALVTAALYGAPVLGTLFSPPPAHDVVVTWSPPVVQLSLDGWEDLTAEEEVRGADGEDAAGEPDGGAPEPEAVAEAPQRDAAPPEPEPEGAPEPPEVAALTTPDAPAQDVRPRGRRPVKDHVPDEARQARVAAAKAAAANGPTPAPAKAGSKGKCPADHPQIVKVGDNHWQISRDLVDYYTRSIAHLSELGGYNKLYKEGDVKGRYIAGFGCRSPLWQGGLRSKDVVQTINDKKVTTVLQILGIWLGQRKRDHFEVLVWRNGRNVTLTYDIV